MRSLSLLALLAVLAPAPARAVGAGCSNTSGSLVLEKVKASAVGSQILGCVNRSLDILSSSVPVLGAGSTAYFERLLVDEIGALRATGGLKITSTTLVASSMSITGADGLEVQSATRPQLKLIDPANEDYNLSTTGGIFEVGHIGTGPRLRLDTNGRWVVGSGSNFSHKLRVEGDALFTSTVAGQGTVGERLAYSAAIAGGAVMPTAYFGAGTSNSRAVLSAGAQVTGDESTSGWTARSSDGGTTNVTPAALVVTAGYFNFLGSTATVPGRATFTPRRFAVLGKKGLLVQDGAGISATDPAARLEVRAAEADTDVLRVSSATVGTAMFAVDRVGHVISAGAAPSVSDGSLSAESTDFAMKHTALNSFADVTFAEPFAVAPMCVAAGTAHALISSLTTTGFRISNLGAGDVNSIICVGVR